MDALLLPAKEVVSVHFISFLLHQHPEYRQAVSQWKVQIKGLTSGSQIVQLFRQAVPNHILRPVQEEYIKQGKPQAKHSSIAAGGSEGGSRTGSMASQQPRPPAQQSMYQHATAAQQQAQAQLAASRGLLPNMPGGAPPRGQQFQGSNNAWANTGTALGMQQPQQQQQQRTVSPGPGQQPGVPVTAANAAQLQAHLQSQQLLLQQALAAQQASGKAQYVQVGNQLVPLNQSVAQLLLQQQVAQAQAQSQLAARTAHQQQQAGQPGRRPGTTAPAAAAAAAGKQQQQGTMGGVPASNSAGSLGMLAQPGQQRPGVQLPGVASLGQQRPPGQPAAGAFPGMGMAGFRPGSMYQPGYTGAALVRPGLPGFAGAAGMSPAALAAQHLATLQPGEAPRMSAPDGYEWVQCASRDGSPGWYALPKARADAHRAQAKRKADDSAAGQPPARAGAGVRRKVDDDVTAGADVNELDVLGTGELAAELARNEGARAVVVEQGNVQEEYVLNLDPTMALVAREAKRQGVRSLGEGVYAFLSLAAEAHLTDLMHSLVKTRLQREDLGKGYKGVEKVDDRLRSQLFQIQKREKEAARKREEEERDELARLGQTRKKLAEEDKKAAKAAQTARQLEQQQKNLGTTLTKMGIGRRTFGTMSALGRPAAGAAQPKAGFTKPELAEAKAAAGSGATAAAGAAADGVGTAAADDPAAAVKQEPGMGGAAAGAAAGSAAAAAAGGGSGAPPVRPMSLQHQLLNAANAVQAPGGVAPAFVAGGASTGRGQDGEEGLRELMLADLIAVLERHPLYCKSQQLYSLYALAGLPAGK